MKRGSTNHDHPALWATLTIAAFPLVSLSLSAAGIDPLRSFAAGALASLLILLLEAAVRGRWWISDPAIAKHLSDPSFGWRLLVLTGIIVLMFQTFLLTAFMMDRTLDTNVARFILKRECASPVHPLFGTLCRELDSNSNVDAASMAVRDAAERRFFPEGFVTCAVRPLDTTTTPQTCLSVAVIRCDRWVVGTITRVPVSVDAVEKTVVASLTLNQDGVYRVDGWSDDPSSSEWSTLGGPTAQQALSRAGVTLNEKRSDLQTETFRRAMERLQSK